MSATLTVSCDRCSVRTELPNTTAGVPLPNTWHRLWHEQGSATGVVRGEHTDLCAGCWAVVQRALQPKETP